MPATSLLTSSFQRFFRTAATGGVLLVGCAAVALAFANSPLADSYHHAWQTPITLSAGGHALTLTAHQLINDGLMAIFFLLVGLEIKREVLVGELASLRQAALPVASAIGGVVVPALIYLATSGSGAASRGWAIPVATDIAFALGALSIAAPLAPNGLKVFLTALAIVDDIGAVLVIAFFYTGTIDWRPLEWAGVTMLLLLALNLLHVRRLAPYLVLGLFLWYFTHESGLHATLAGVVLAFMIPTRTRINALEYSTMSRGLIDDFDRTETGDGLVLTSKGQQEALMRLGHASESVTAPLLRLEHALHSSSSLIVMPLFAFANAGVTLHSFSGSRVTLAIILGLIVGKPLGIAGAAFVTVRSRAAALPQHVTWSALRGCAFLGGIGFTMSLFIATLAFEGSSLLDEAKVGILAGSTIAGIVGGFLVSRAAKRAA